MLCYEAQVLNTHLLLKEEQLVSVNGISYAMVQCLSLLHSFAKYSKNPGSVHCRFVQIFDKELRRLIYLG